MDGRRRQEAAGGSRDQLPRPGGATSCGGPRLSHRGKGRFAVGGSLRRKVRELRRLVPGGRRAELHEMDGRRRQEVARRSRDELPRPGGATSCGGPRLSHRGKGRFAVGGSLRRKVRELRRLVPGGRQLPAEQLLLHTADYILRLSLQVQLLRALSKLYMP
ncbi:hypothetical protein MUK42_15971 [Musa troglodytarum]|uniref:BHLH domain-containing protein n=1 Tax=Musa troglodytarum TaxID=320322 RepID=A0A9E7H836_9LILI|nr:hypothetical protein MUK42_15971 [Musa troglodytarum]